MNVHNLSPDAQAKVTDNYAVVNGLAIQEVFNEAGNAMALGLKTEVRFYPKTMYLVRTGICIEGVRKPYQIYVRPTYEAFLTGIEVKRVEVASTDGEVIVFVTSSMQDTFKRMVGMFEIVQLGQDAIPTHGTGFDFSVNKSKELPVVAIRSQEPRRDVPRADAPVNEAKKVEDWLNAPDAKEGQIGQSNETRPSLPRVGTAAEALASSPSGPGSF